MHSGCNASRFRATPAVCRVDPDDEAVLVAGLSPLVARMRQDCRRHPRASTADPGRPVRRGPLPERVLRAAARVWERAQDRNAPPLMARSLAAMIPDCTPMFFPDDGHLSIIGLHAEAMLSSLG